MLPGQHEIGAGLPTKSLIFEAEAGRVYTFFWGHVRDTQLVGKEDESGSVIEGQERYYVWLKDESGTVIAGEKPPPG